MSADSLALNARGKARSYGIVRIGAFSTAFAILALGAVNIHIDSNRFDIWQHLAAIRFLAKDLLAPPPLYLTEIYEVHLYTPFHVFWAAVMTAGDLDIWTVVAASSVVSIALFMLGCHLMARYILADPRLDFILFCTMLLFWGVPAWWSGVYSLAQISLQIAYPSFFALSAVLVVGALFFEAGFRSLAWQAGAVIAIAALFVIHPITASFLLIFLATKVLMMPKVGVRGAALALWPAPAGLGLGLLWPYFSVPAVILATRSSPEIFGDFNVFYTEPLSQIGFAVLGLVALPSWRRSHAIRFLSALLAILLSVYGINYALHGSHILSRYLIFIAFALQLLWVAWIASLASPKARFCALGVFAATGVVAGTLQIYIGAARTYSPYVDLVRGTSLGTHSAAQQYRDLESLGTGITIPGAVVMAPAVWAYPLAALTGANVVALLHHAPTMIDSTARQDDARQFFAAATSCEARADILRRRKADYILVLTSDDAAQAIRACAWRAVIRNGRFVLYENERQREP